MSIAHLIQERLLKSHVFVAGGFLASMQMLPIHGSFPCQCLHLTYLRTCDLHPALLQSEAYAIGHHEHENVGTGNYQRVWISSS